MPLTSKDFDTCPICQGRRFKGRSLPICKRCEETLVHVDFLRLRTTLKADNASGSVIQLLDAAMILDAKEALQEFSHIRKIRKPRQAHLSAANNGKPQQTTANNSQP